MAGSEFDGPMASRVDQLAALSQLDINDEPVVVHGSLAHFALQGLELPPETKLSGDKRDIDIYTPGATGKFVVEGLLRERGLTSPNPVDAGLCGLLARDAAGRLGVQKNGIEVELNDPEGIFSETVEYEIVGGDGQAIRSFSPAGLLGVHTLEPYQRITHRKTDRDFVAWCEANDVTLPPNISGALAEFHEAYRQKYPYGAALRHASEIYALLLPERVRKLFRPYTHRLMHRHSGRENPFE